MPKKIIDQRLLAISCQTNILTADLFFQTKYKLTPIKVYKTVHTGPKTQDGGLKKGLIKVVYQVGIEPTVNKEPIIPAA